MRTGSDLLRITIMAGRKDAKKNNNGDGGAGIALDMAGEDSDGRMSQHDMESCRLSVAAAIQQWVETETDDLSDNETSADRLLAMMIGIADADQDGELDDDEQAVLESALECAWDYLAQKGVDESDIDSLLNEWDSDVAERVRDLIASVLPEGEDESNADIDDFGFGDNDDVAMDAAYKNKMAIRGGKKVRIRKRVSGTVRLSAKQKLAIRKAQIKSHSSAAKVRRKRSMRMRKKSGLR